MDNNACHKCKLEQFFQNCNIVINCPYIYNTIDIKEPKVNSQAYVAWHYVEKFLTYRKQFGKYANYLSLNDEFSINYELYQQLKVIPEFSLQNAFHSTLSLDEIKDKILHDPKFHYTLYNYTSKPFFDSLLLFYKEEIERHRQFVNCRILMDEQTTKYLNWRDSQQDPLIEIGDYYFISIHKIYNTDHLPSFIYYKKTEDNYIYLSFLKKDINLVYEYCQHNNLLPFDYANEFLKETLKNMLNKDDE